MFEASTATGDSAAASRELMDDGRSALDAAPSAAPDPSGLSGSAMATLMFAGAADTPSEINDS